MPPFLIWIAKDRMGETGIGGGSRTPSSIPTRIPQIEKSCYCNPVKKNATRIAWWGFPIVCLLSSGILSSRLLVEGGTVGYAGVSLARGSLIAGISRHPAFAFGFRNFLADLAWLQAVQSAGNREMAPGDYDRLSLWLNVVANYDPRFDVPYLLGGLVLGESPTHAREALGILSRGRAQYPSDWRLQFYIGYTQYFVLRDPVSGGKAMAESAKLPGAPEYLPRLAARMLAEGRDPDAALSFLTLMVGQETDAARRKALERRYREVLVERDLQRLENAVAAYRASVGRNPERLADLVRNGFLEFVPREPGGGSYRITTDGSVYSDRTRQRLKPWRK
jgi:hypothetical protein